MKYLLLATLLQQSLITFAQPVLTQSTSPISGDVHAIFNLFETSVGPSGPAVFWALGDHDFAESALDTEYFLDCGTLTLCDSFPGTTLYQHRKMNIPTFFYHETPSALSVNGCYDTTLTTYSDYMDILHYPFTYGTTYTDTFSGTYTKDSILYTRYGTINVTGDAYGTMATTWYDTFYNALRVHTVKNYFDSSSGHGIFHSYADNCYSWYVPGYREAFVTISTNTTDGLDTVRMSLYNDQKKDTTTTFTPAYSNSQQIEVFPNPVASMLFVHEMNGLISNLVITNLIGVTMHIGSYNDAQLCLDVSTYPAGIYFMKINNDKILKIIKE